MPVPITDYLFQHRNRLLADLLTSAAGAKLTLHLSDDALDDEILATEADLTEITDPNYAAVELTDWEVVEMEDGLVMLRKDPVSFDFGAGPLAEIKATFVWVEYESEAIARQTIGAFLLPVTFPINDDTPVLSFIFEWKIGWIDLDTNILSELAKPEDNSSDDEE